MLIDFVEPWEVIKSRRAQACFEEELKKEINSKSALYGCFAKAVAKRVDCDNILFMISDDTSEIRLAVVHLTWSRKKEVLPWPKIQLFASQQEFIDKQMMPDATEYNS